MITREFGNEIRIASEPPLIIERDGNLLAPAEWSGSPQRTHVTFERKDGSVLAGLRQVPTGFDLLGSMAALGGGRIFFMRHILSGVRLRLIVTRDEWWWDEMHRVEVTRG